MRCKPSDQSSIASRRGLYSARCPVTNSAFDFFWEAVEKTLVEVFASRSDQLSELRSEISGLPRDEQECFFHQEPLHLVEDFLDKRATPRQAQLYASLAESWQIEMRQVLACDHHGSMKPKLKAALSEAGFRVIETTSLRRSLEAIRHQRPELIIVWPATKPGEVELSAIAGACASLDDARSVPVIIMGDSTYDGRIGEWTSIGGSTWKLADSNQSFEDTVDLAKDLIGVKKAAKTPSSAGERTFYIPRIGTCLVVAGFMRSEDVERTLKEKKPTERFGDVAVRLKLIKKEDLNDVLARQAALRTIQS